MPQAHLTDRLLPSLFRKAKQENKRLEVMDTGFTRAGTRRRGFGIRISPKGSGAWFIRYAIRKRHQRRTLGKYPGMTLAGARAAASELLEMVDQGLDPDVEARRSGSVVTFNELADAYLEHIKPRLKSWRQRELAINKDLRPVFGEMPAHEIRRGDFRRVLRRIHERGAPIQANRTQAVLSAMYNFGLDHEDLLADVMEYNPLSRLKKLGEEKPANRALSWAEVAALWPSWVRYGEHSDKRHGSPAGLAQMMGLLTGQRLNEILRMSWGELEDVDESGGRWWEIPAERAKNGRVHRVYLAPRAAEIVASVKSEALPWVFPSPVDEQRPMTNLSKAVQSCVESSSVAGWTFKTLRATWATLSAEIGTEPWLISEVLNHTPDGIPGTGARVTSVHYVQSKHRHADKKRAAMMRFADRLTLELGERGSKVLAFSG